MPVNGEDGCQLKLISKQNDSLIYSIGDLLVQACAWLMRFTMSYAPKVTT